MKSTLKENANKQYIYFIRIGEPADRLFKIGTTNDINRRMGEHRRTYKTDVEILGVIPVTSKYTTLRVEENMISEWKQNEGWIYKRNDRFIIPEDVTSVKIKVRKEYEISLI